MPMISSAASAQNTARRFGAYERTTNLPNESAISLIYRSRMGKSHYTKPRPATQGLTLSSILTPPRKAMLWLKALHVIAVVTWFAGLFYLPRLYVYHADATDVISTQRFE